MKAILVVDMPNNCYDCQYCRFDARRYNFRGCVLTDTEVQDGTIDICKEVHSCCPLKPMPQRQNTDEEKPSLEYIYEAETLDEFQSRGASYLYGHIDGWNACFEEIEE